MIEAKLRHILNRKNLYGCTALALVLGPLSPAHASTCIQIGTIFNCVAPLNGPVASAANGASVSVGGVASVISTDSDVAAIALSGGNGTIINNGTIANTNASNGAFAITGAGNGLIITNNGDIASGDRAIEMLSGTGLVVINNSGATITSRRQGIRSLEGVTDAVVNNDGTISATDGRALQLRGNGATVVNTGTITGGEEVIEARGDFTLVNSGTVQINDPSIADEDGVQFASGVVTNSGLIEGTDDGIDFDEGAIFNLSDGVIRSLAPDTGDNSGIDIDEVFDDGIITRQNLSATIVNAGLIEGPSAIGADEAATNSVVIENSGILLGRGGTAVRLAPNQGDSTLELSGLSEIFGDVRFGSGDDEVVISTLNSGALIEEGVFRGGLGNDSVIFDALAYDLGDFVTFDVFGDQVDLSFGTVNGIVSGTFISFENFFVGGAQFSAAALSAQINPPAVPLPAGLPLLIAGLAGFAAVRRVQSRAG